MRSCSIFICLIVTLAFACVKKAGRPGDILPEKKMQAVLWDIMRADQFLNDYVFSRDSAADKKMQSSKMYAQIMAVHKIDWRDFQKSFKWYSEHTEMLKAVMDSIAAQAPAAVQPMVKPAADSAKAVLPATADTTVKPALPRPLKDTTRKKRKTLKPFRGE